MQAYIDGLFANHSRELHKIINPILARYGGLSQKDRDDFYSAVGEALAKIYKENKNFDPSKGEIKGYIYSAINKTIIDENKAKNAQKRNAYEKDKDGNLIKIPTLSIDAPMGEDNSSTIGDFLYIKSEDCDSIDTLFDEAHYGYSENIETFLGNLSELPRKIAIMIMGGYSANEIKKKLKITDKQYQDCWKIINSYENKRILYKKSDYVEGDNMNTLIAMENVSESYKNTSYSIDSISKQLQKKRIRDDHILQRHSGQWKGFEKSELISDILRGKSLTQIIISEEIKNGLRMQWLIDGKQRCTTLDDFLHDGFALSKNIKKYNIRYQTTKVDANGYEVLNQDGFTEIEIKEFDIRGKKFSQLPEELQEIFKDRQIPVLYHMNCTKQDIAEDIARFNRNRPMNKAQNGWLGLDECFAEFVGNISKMQFFQPYFSGSTYTDSNHISGSIRRIIVEAIMVSDFIEDYNKDFDKICEFLSEEASDSNFTEFYSLVERLTNVCDERVSKMFNVKDSFLWMGLFSKFINLSIDDNKFIDFLVEFDTNLRNMRVNGATFEELCVDKETGKSRSTKDRLIVLSKMELLERLMLDYFEVNTYKSSDTRFNDSFNGNIVEFIQNCVDANITEEDVEVCIDFYENELKIEVDNNSKLLDVMNNASMLALIAYIMESNIVTINGFKKWIVDFFRKNNTYMKNQKENYLYMKENLIQFIEEGKYAV